MKLKIHAKQTCIIHGKGAKPLALFRRCEFCMVPINSPKHRVYLCVWAGQNDLTDEQYAQCLEDQKQDPGPLPTPSPIQVGVVHNDPPDVIEPVKPVSTETSCVSQN